MARRDYHQRDAGDALRRLYSHLAPDGLLCEGSSSSTGDLLVRAVIICYVKRGSTMLSLGNPLSPIMAHNATLLLLLALALFICMPDDDGTLLCGYLCR
jgi:hypothetical protein